MESREFKARAQDGYCKDLVFRRVVKERRRVISGLSVPQGADLWVESQGRWERWQVKAAVKQAESAGGFYVVCGETVFDVTSGETVIEPVDGGRFEWLIAVDPESGRMWKVPESELVGSRRRQLRDSCAW